MALVGRLDDVWIGGDRPEGRGRQRRVTFGFNVRPNENIVVKAGYQINATFGRPMLDGDARRFQTSLAYFF